MDPELPTLAGELRKRGFYCAAMTSAGFVSAVFGFDLGFDIFRMGAWGIFKLDAAAQLGLATRESRPEFFPVPPSLPMPRALRPSRTRPFGLPGPGDARPPPRPA